MINELKSATVFDNLNRKNTIRVGEIWMHGTLGIISIDRIYRINNKKRSTTIQYTDKKGIKWASTANYMGAGNWQVYINLLFKVS